jgi:hypothetical protein
VERTDRQLRSARGLRLPLADEEFDAFALEPLS